MDYFHDRRNFGHLPTEDDYNAPMDKKNVAEANRRFRTSGVPGVITAKNRGAADNIVRETTKMRNKARKNAGKDFKSVGEYLEFLNGIPEEKDG